MVTLGAIIGTLYYNFCRYRTKQTPSSVPPNTDLPSHLKCEISRSNPQGSTCCRLRSSALGYRATDVLKGKGRVTQRYPREVLRRDDREGTTDVSGILGL